MIKRFSFCVLGCFCVFLLSGCWGGGHEDIQEWLVEQRSVVKPRVQPLKESSNFSPKDYFAEGGIDPFNMQKLTQVLSRESVQNTSNMTLLFTEQNRRKEELEGYPLDSMSMVGSLKKKGKTRRCCV